jgi:hypothetical protein
MLKTIQGELGMSREALGEPHSWVLVARCLMVGEGRAVARAARARVDGKCMVVVFGLRNGGVGTRTEGRGCERVTGGGR